ncbi:hypothetical protein A4H97_23690 [Niastella yeongjuensis]|uniref:Prenyltransferase n=2 Tax=Niastella yeongjuensis TaxID=354355 RepID=A0A1V9F579_9BACT|nr:UbiA family prenyltransferase [Niastella yeongjuensis]OQP53451.1 hypothetical protein A4H97_23690 [Niastella yeongjuensis]SEP11912.1 UbiA prenyltransferase family protein [Niastella yeongjuensis]
MNKILRLLFWGNYFVGFLAIAFNIEAAVQLKMPYNSLRYYALLFMLPVIYYTYAYQHQPINTEKTDPRSRWYARHRRFIHYSQMILLALSVIIAISLSFSYFDHIQRLPFIYWAFPGFILFTAVLYYGLLPGFMNLRRVGWLKAFVIGFVWAGYANLAPIIMTSIEKGNIYPDSILWLFLFVKNWMFCTVNAIIFDIKDYPTDANKQLKTFVVRFGLRHTIFFILIPLLGIGLLSLLFFTVYRGIMPVRIFINCLPFVLMLYVVYTMRKRHSLIYYLVLIDGALLFKAMCGILAMAIAA